MRISLTFGERLALSAAALLFVAAIPIQLVWRRLDPRIALAVWVNAEPGRPFGPWEERGPESATDPWGTPWVIESHDESGSTRRLYSAGPNQQDDRGDGDDLVLVEGTDRQRLRSFWRLGFPPRYASPVASYSVYVGLTTGFRLAGFLVLSLVWAWRVARRPRSESASVQLALAGVMIAPLIAVAWLSPMFVPELRSVTDSGQGATPPLVAVRWGHATFGTAVVVLFLAAVHLRTRAPSSEESADGDT